MHFFKKGGLFLDLWKFQNFLESKYKLKRCYFDVSYCFEDFKASFSNWSWTTTDGPQTLVIIDLVCFMSQLANNRFHQWWEMTSQMLQVFGVMLNWLERSIISCITRADKAISKILLGYWYVMNKQLNKSFLWYWILVMEEVSLSFGLPVIKLSENHFQ